MVCVIMAAGLYNWKEMRDAVDIEKAHYGTEAQ